MEELFNGNQFVSGALLLSILTFVGYQLKAIPKVVWEQIKRKLIYTVTIEETDKLYFFIEKWLTDHYENNYRNVDATIEGKSTPNNSYHPETISESGSRRAHKREDLVIWQRDDYFIIRYGKNRKRLVVSKGREKLEGAKDLFSAYFNRFTITGYSAKKDITNLLNEIIDYNQQFKETNPPSIYSYTHSWSHVGYCKSKTLDRVFIEDKDKLVTDIEMFLKDRKWYSERLIPYKRGYLFFGKPGNGKTAMCLSIANHLKRDIYFLNLNDINSDSNIQNAFNELKEGSMLVLEDVDVSFGGKRDEKKNKASMSAILNCLDGAFSKEDIITIMTTNHKENLDPALIRAGRVDMHIEMTNPKKGIVEQYIQKFFEDDSLYLEEYIDESLAMVDIQDICLRNKENVYKALAEVQKNTHLVKA